MAALPRARSSTISKIDMEASRLVFVFVKDVKPKRKVAVPVPDGYTWGDFIQQVKNKLKISGVKEVFLASSGQRVTSLDELQDIDELCVVEGLDIYVNGGTPVASEAALRAGANASTSEILPQTNSVEPGYRQQIMSPGQHKVGIADGASSRVDNDERKYAKRVPNWKRTLQRVLPSLFAPGLPVTTKDTEDRAGPSSTTRRRRKRSPISMRNVLLGLAVACCLATMLWFMFKANIAVT